MKIFEVENQLPTTLLRPGVMLYHGTKSEGDFTVPDGPAWFAFSEAKAAEWIDWAIEPPTGRTFGERRVLHLEVRKPITLIDTRTEKAWQQLCQYLTGDPEIGTGVAAAAMMHTHFPGWLGRVEVMIVHPDKYLRPQITNSPARDTQAGLAR